MKIRNLFLFGLLVLMFSCGNKSGIIPDKELRNMTPKKILELGAEKYTNYEYADALAYYASIERIFPEDNDVNNEAKVWAKYEMGYIKYQEKKYKEALAFFEEVLKMKTPSVAPVTLANQMIDKIMNITK
jgi:outer membrane protein assembly factor BamD (BamD/ComL family)